MIVALALLAALGHAAEAPAVELEAWRATHDRFAERMREMTGDAKAWVDSREAEERANIATSYDQVLDNLRETERANRDVAMAGFQSYLRRYPRAAYADHVRFRLADLEFEVASETYQEQADAYFAALESDDLATLERLGAEPKLDLREPVALYKEILAANADRPIDQQYERLDGVYLMLAYCYIEPRAAQADEVTARAILEELIRARPESDLADRSHLFIGNFLFAESKFAEAIARYDAVLAKGTDGLYFDEALYKLAWTHYKVADYERALPAFTRLLDLSEDLEHDTGKESAFAKDAVKYTAYSLADRALDNDRTAVEEAKAFFASAGERPWEWDVYVALADVLLRYARPEEAIEIYNALQDDPRWMFRPENPTFLMEVVRLYGSNILTRDLAKAGAERLKLTQRYNEGGEWWNRNRNHPEAIAVARGYIEQSLLGVANEYYVRAQETGSAEDYRGAADGYLEYLQKFPIADDYYEQQWLYANVLKESMRLEEAGREFASLQRSGRFHAYVDGAVYSLMDVARLGMVAASGGPEVAPVNPTVESTVTTPYGKTVDRWAMSADRQAFVKASRALLEHTFSAQTADVDYAAETDQRRPGLLYTIGQLEFVHHRYPEARAELEAVIARWPRTEEASFAAALIVDSYTAEGDLEAVRRSTKAYLTAGLGPTGAVDPSFANTLEGATFTLAGQLAQKGDSAGAAAAFLAFLDEFPRSKFASDALHDAAFSYQQLGRVEDANKLYERFVNEYPADERSRRLLFRIAANYEAAFQLDKAIDYYGRLVRQFPDDLNAPDAAFNAAFLQVGLGQYLAAAKGYEAYAANYPARDDRERVEWRAGEQYEAVDPAQAINFYRNYLKKYGLANPDHAVEARGRLASLLLAKGDKAGAQREVAEVVRTFQAVTAGGGQLGAAAHEAAASADFPGLQKAYDALVDDKLTGNDDRDAVLLDETKPAEIRALDAKVSEFIGRYQSFEFNSAALYLGAMSTLYLADLGLSIEPPKGLSEEEEWAFRDLLDEKIYPQYKEVEALGIKKLADLITAAGAQRRWSVWIERAATELNRRVPETYPAPHPEARRPHRGESSLPVGPSLPPEAP